MRLIGQTTKENYNVILITILKQVPLQLYKLRINDAISLRRNINHNVCTCPLLFCVKKATFCHATISTMCNTTDM